MGNQCYSISIFFPCSFYYAPLIEDGSICMTGLRVTTHTLIILKSSQKRCAEKYEP